MATQLDPDTLVRGIYANRNIVRVGFAAGIVLVVVWAMLEPWTEAISALRLPVYLSVALACGLIMLLLSGPPHRAIYPAMLGVCAWIQFALLLTITDSLFGEPGLALRSGVVPLELTALPVAMIIPYVYLMPRTASLMNLAAICGYGLLGVVYGLWHRNLPWEELAHGLWTINSCICIGALASIFAKVHIRHSRLVAATLEERLEACDNEIGALQQQLDWDAQLGCLNGRGMRRQLQAELSSPGEDLLIGMVQRRAHPPPGPSARVPKTWDDDLRSAVQSLSEIFPGFSIGFHTQTTLVVWARARRVDEFISAAEVVQKFDQQQPDFFATARNYIVLDTDKSLMLEAILDDLASDLFLRAHGLR